MTPDIITAARAARTALSVAHGALLECSPCAAPDCKVTQQEWLDEARNAVEKAAADLRTALAKAEAPTISWDSRGARTVNGVPDDVQAEPVAWHVCSVNSDGSLSLEFAAPWEELAHEHINDAINEHDIDGATSWVVRPVYASPRPIATEPSPAAPPQVPQPLRDSQINAIVHRFDRDADACSDEPHEAMALMRRVCRAIEAAHGIGAKP